MIASEVSDVASFADKRTVLLGSMEESVIAEAMNAVREKTGNLAINNAFDYRKYQERASKWATVILNGGGKYAAR